MHLDKDGLIVQADGDANDQLNRVALMSLWHPDAWYDKMLKLEVKPGVFVRHLKNTPDNVSGDQLVPVFAAAMNKGDVRLQALLTLRLISRLGFAQNYRRMNENTLKVPDFILHRALPFLLRALPIRPLHYVADLFTLLLTASALFPYVFHDNKIKPVLKGLDYTDQDVNMVNTLFAVIHKHPTFIGKFCVRMYRKYRTKVYGESDDQVKNGLRYYHHPKFLGNPEVGEVQVSMWEYAKKVSKAIP